MFNGVSEPTRVHRCSSCGALYEMVAVTKRSEAKDKRTLCKCGWPLKEWTSYHDYVFTLLPSTRPD